MTREEAIFYIKELQKTYASMDKKVAEAVDMAIEALHREEAEEKGYYHRIRPSAETHEIRTETHGVCSDLISRSDALMELNGVCSNWQDDAKVAEIIHALPSAEAYFTDGNKIAEWIFNPTDAIDLMFAKPKCSRCGFESSDGGNYCSNCGARMKGGNE